MGKFLGGNQMNWDEFLVSERVVGGLLEVHFHGDETSYRGKITFVETTSVEGSDEMVVFTLSDTKKSVRGEGGTVWEPMERMPRSSFTKGYLTSGEEPQSDFPRRPDSPSGWWIVYLKNDPRAQ